MKCLQQKLQPHEPQMEDLKIVGEGLEEKLWNTVNREISMKDIEKLLRTSQPETFDAMQVREHFH